MVNELSQRNGKFLQCYKAICVAGALTAALLMFAEPSLAQEGMQCSVREEKIGNDPVLIGGCGKNEVMVSSAEKTQISSNLEKNSIAVVVYNSGGARIYVLREDIDGSAILEDLTYQFKDESGTYSRFGIDGLSVDLSQFDKSGLIGISAPGSDVWTAKASLDTLIATDIERQLVVERQATSESP